jgi:hypothetical protein
MEPDGSFSCSREPATGSYPQCLFYKFNFNIIFLFTPLVWSFPNKFCLHFSPPHNATGSVCLILLNLSTLKYFIKLPVWTSLKERTKNMVIARSVIISTNCNIFPHKPNAEVRLYSESLVLNSVGGCTDWGFLWFPSRGCHAAMTTAVSQV